MITKELIIEFIKTANERFKSLMSVKGGHDDCSFSGADDVSVEFTGSIWLPGFGSEDRCYWLDWKFFLCSDSVFKDLLDEYRVEIEQEKIEKAKADLDKAQVERAQSKERQRLDDLAELERLKQKYEQT